MDDENDIPLSSILDDLDEEQALELLQDPSIDPSEDDNFAIQWASEHNYGQIVELLLQDPRVDPNVNDGHAFKTAVMSGYHDVILSLLQDPRTVVENEFISPLSAAIQNNDYYTVIMLLDDSRIDPSINDNEAIIRAAYAGDAKIFKLLLRDPRVDPYAAYATAKKRGNKKIVKMLKKYYEKKQKEVLDGVKVLKDKGMPVLVLMQISDELINVPEELKMGESEKWAYLT